MIATSHAVQKQSPCSTMKHPAARARSVGAGMPDDDKGPQKYHRVTCPARARHIGRCRVDGHKGTDNGPHRPTPCAREAGRCSPWYHENGQGIQITGRVWNTTPVLVSSMRNHWLVTEGQVPRQEKEG